MTRKNLLVALATIMAVGLIAGPLAANENEWSTGSEYEWKDLDCQADGQYPDTQDAPTGSQCLATHNHTWEGPGTQTYFGREWTNTVSCNDDPVTPDNPAGVNLYADGDPGEPSPNPGSWGGAGMCNEEGAVPVYGRVVVGGSWDHGGFYAYADGTDDNEPDQAQGWARADATEGDMVQVRCGPADGKRDAQFPADGEQDECG